MKKKLTDILVCSVCGSKNVELQSGNYNGVFHVLEKLLDMVQKNKMMASGRKYAICKDCGHKDLIQIL